MGGGLVSFSLPSDNGLGRDLVIVPGPAAEARRGDFPRCGGSLKTGFGTIRTSPSFDGRCPDCSDIHYHDEPDVSHFSARWVPSCTGRRCIDYQCCDPNLGAGSRGCKGIKLNLTFIALMPTGCRLLVPLELLGPPT